MSYYGFMDMTQRPTNQIETERENTMLLSLDTARLETEMRPLHSLKSGDRVVRGSGISTVLRNAPYRKTRHVSFREADGSRDTYVGHFNEVIEVVI